MAVYKKQGRLYVDNLNIKLIESLVDRFETIQEFLKYVGFNNVVLRNIKNGGMVRMATIDILLNAFEDIKPQDLILDYKEEDYTYFDIDLDKHKPTEKDLKDCEEIIRIYSNTIKEFTRLIGVEKHNRVINLLKRVILESQYYGVILEKMNKSAKVIGTIEKVRNKSK